jgi:hypothetical protein
LLLGDKKLAVATVDWETMILFIFFEELWESEYLRESYTLFDDSFDLMGLI